MESGRLFWLIVAAVVALGGLFLSSHAADDAFYYTGLVVFVGAVVCLFGLIGRAQEPHDG